MNRRVLHHTGWVLWHRQDLISAGELSEACSPELMVALAEYALRRGYLPVALFRWLLHHEDSWTTVPREDLAAARKRLIEHRKRQRMLAKQARSVGTVPSAAAKLAERTYIESDAYAVFHRGPGYRVPPLPRYSQAEIDAFSPPPPNHLRDALRRVLPAIFIVAAVAYLLTFRL